MRKSSFSLSGINLKNSVYGKYAGVIFTYTLHSLNHLRQDDTYEDEVVREVPIYPGSINTCLWNEVNLVFQSMPSSIVLIKCYDGFWQPFKCCPKSGFLALITIWFPTPIKDFHMTRCSTTCTICKLFVACMAFDGMGRKEGYRS